MPADEIQFVRSLGVKGEIPRWVSGKFSPFCGFSLPPPIFARSISSTAPASSIASIRPANRPSST